MTADFEERWREAMARYQAAVAEYDAAADATSRAVGKGDTPSDVQISKEELARAKVVETRQEIFRLLREQRMRRGA